jgi:RNA polymerase sigma-70 factor (sigma-E family)
MACSRSGGERVLSDVPDDFEAFAAARLPDLLRYATALTGDRELAADLVQDVLTRAFARWSRIRRTEAPDRYLKRMITNAHLSHRRRWSVRRVTPAEDLEAHVPVGPDPTVLGVEHGERVDQLWRVLAGLPARQRAVLVLRYYEGLSDAEIAEVLDCAPGTVRSSASRALRALRLDEDIRATP